MAFMHLPTLNREQSAGNSALSIVAALFKRQLKTVLFCVPNT